MTSELEIIKMSFVALHFPLVYKNSYLQDKGKMFMAKYYCVRLHALFGAALAAGLVAGRMLIKTQVPKLALP